jgi:flagellar assembly protein FliH
MTLSSEPRLRGRGVHVARVLRGDAVERAQPAALHVDEPHGEPSSGRRTPTERIEHARREAYDEGFRAGQEAARDRSQQAREESLRRGAEALRHAAAAVEVARANAITVVEEDAATLAVELARTLLDHELSRSDEEVTAAVRRALRLTTPGEDLVVRLHPDEMLDPSALEPYVTDCRISVVADAGVAPGGCVIDAGPCRIDAQIESALSRVRWALLSSGRSSSETSAAPEPPPSGLHRTQGGAS